MRIGPVAFLAAQFLATSALALPPCVGTDGRVAAWVTGEVAGKHESNINIGPGWRFSLQPAPHGWDIRLFDRDGMDLSQITPPFRGVPNPREVYGWHFRNAANTGANQGDVNAPQRLRLFAFSPALTGTGGFKPSGGMVEPSPQDGRGAFEIVDMGLSDLEPGQRARMTYLKFEACLTWDPATVSDTVFSPEDRETFGSCGLRPPLQLSSHLVPLNIGGDFDGDGALDEAAPVVRATDGKRGIAICRAGTWLDVIGLDEPMGAHLVPEYFDGMDYWSLHTRREVGQGVAEGPPPVLTGDALLLGTEGASSVLVYWTGEGWTSYWQGD